jgi:hypothetical protein
MLFAQTHRILKLGFLAYGIERRTLIFSYMRPGFDASKGSLSVVS